MERRPALGKGLSALIPDAPEPPRQGAIDVDIDLLAPSDQQPRLMLDDCRARRPGRVDQGQRHHSAHPGSANGRYVSHHRRRTAMARRAAGGTPQGAGRDPRHAGGLRAAVLELALVENLQREDLNPVDEALAYQRLAEEFGLTQDQIAAAVGQGPHVGRQLSAPAAVAGGSARRPRLRRALDGTCAGTAGAAGCGVAASGRAGRDFQVAVGP